MSVTHGGTPLTHAGLVIDGGETGAAVGRTLKTHNRRGMWRWHSPDAISQGRNGSVSGDKPVTRHPGDVRVCEESV